MSTMWPTAIPHGTLTATPVPCGNLIDAQTLRGAPATAAIPRGALTPGSLRRIREHIEQRIADPLDIAELAAVAGLSESHFSRAFKRSTGTSPHRYVLVRRVLLAAELLRDTPHRLTEIALAVGFADQSHFTRRFGFIMRETPGAFRRRHR